MRAVQLKVRLRNLMLIAKGPPFLSLDRPLEDDPCPVMWKRHSTTSFRSFIIPRKVCPALKPSSRGPHLERDQVLAKSAARGPGRPKLSDLKASKPLSSKASETTSRRCACAVLVSGGPAVPRPGPALWPHPPGAQAVADGIWGLRASASGNHDLEEQMQSHKNEKSGSGNIRKMSLM